MSIILYRDSMFNSTFQQRFQEDLGSKVYHNTTFLPQTDAREELDTQVDHSNAFYPKTDGQSEQTIRLEDMFCKFFMQFEGQWEPHLASPKFVCNNSCQLSIQIAPFKVFYGWHYRSLICQVETSEVSPRGTNLFHESLDNVG